jgi:hypothetical protein
MNIDENISLINEATVRLIFGISSLVFSITLYILKKNI